MSTFATWGPWDGDRRTFVEIAGAAVVIVAVGLLSAHILHHTCTHGPLGEPRKPEPGTSRSGYCLAIDKPYSWTYLAVLPPLLVAATGITFRRHRRLWVGTAVVALCVVIALVATAPLLNANPTM